MKKNFVTAACVLILAIVLARPGQGAEMPKNKQYTNFTGMKFVRVEPGVFRMGVGNGPLPAELTTDDSLQPEGDYDEKPNHTVTISRPFYIGVYEVTNFQYELFRPEHKKLRRGGDSGQDDEAVVNVNWYDAQAFCRWLSDKEGLPYRLPTEAEWEYACRTGTTTHYSTGDALPEEFSEESRSVRVGQTPPNAWGIYDMHGNVEEWCYDWYGPYEAADQTDPVGRVSGDFKVTRGSDRSTNPYYQRSANRLGTVPEDKHGIIGFRVVIGEMPGTEPLPKAPPALYQIGVRQRVPSDIEKRPDSEEAYFHTPREFVKIPPGNTGPLYEKHNHFTSVTECPNGDLLAIWHTCIGESGRELAVAGSRLRYGQKEWEPASLFWDAPDRNDHGHAMWFDGEEKIYHFQGLADTVRNVALVMRTSSDNGATWSQPQIIAGHGPSRMPVESVFRTKEGFYAISCDKGPNILWISRDQGISWTHPGGSIRGKHATAVQLSDGRLMALGRERDIDGKMPMSISGDIGRTWDYSASEFPPVSWGQRAVLLRLKEGPLLFASFCNKMMITNASGRQHEVSGLFATVSFDEGKSWPHKRLVTDDGPARQVGSLNGEPIIMSPHNTESVGYLAVCQTPDGVIHLLTSRQHYALNLKWVMTLPPAAPTRATPPDAKPLPTKKRLEKVYILSESTGRREWFSKSEDFTKRLSKHKPLKITNKAGGFYERSGDPAGFAAVDQKKGFTVELKTQVIKRKPDAKAVDIELYDGAGSRYALAITDTGVYWYEGYIQGSAFLPLAEFVPAAEGLDNTDAMHTYRIAVRPDRVAQIYRDGKLIGARQHEYRTPRDAYIQLGAGPGAEVLVEYFAYDLSGPYQP
ncbi:MAG: SUMF1/EgtB/PvdO family nonheme iron enzyme [Planctomycetota bacterium]|jgi:formylglycine-generating enzyme required for sulfatase activity